MRLEDDEDLDAVRRRAEEADGPAEEELRGHEDVRAGARPGKEGRQQDSRGEINK